MRQSVERDPVPVPEADTRLEQLRAELRQATADLAQLRAHYDKLRFRAVEKVHWILSKAWPALPVSQFLVWPIARLWALFQRFEDAVVLHRWVDRLLFVDPPAYWICAPGFRRLLRRYLVQEVRERLGLIPFDAATEGFRRYRPDRALLWKWRARAWPLSAPTFTVILRPRGGPPGWRDASVSSVRGQTYPRWELLLPRAAGHASRSVEADSRVRVVDGLENRRDAEATRRALSEARGDFVCWLDEGDVLEPQALHRFADAVLDWGTDILYSDEVVTGEDLDHVLAVEIRPQ